METSELIFSGCLQKAEMLRGKETPISSESGEFEYTYIVYKTFKGQQFKTVTFKAPANEAVNKTVGTIAIVALKKVEQRWILSVDERSCWSHKNEMKEDYHSFPTYEIPTILLYDFPKEMGEMVTLKRLFADGYKDKECFVYPARKVDAQLNTYLSR